MREEIFSYIKKKYKVSPEYPWARYDDNAVFRHGDNRKWFALVMSVRRDKLGFSAERQTAGYSNQCMSHNNSEANTDKSMNEYMNVVNLKIDDMMFRDILLRQEGIIPAYHMNKQHWITVLLDGTVEKDRVCELIDISFAATDSKKRILTKKASKKRDTNKKV